MCDNRGNSIPACLRLLQHLDTGCWIYFVCAGAGVDDRGLEHLQGFLWAGETKGDRVQSKYIVEVIFEGTASCCSFVCRSSADVLGCLGFLGWTWTAETRLCRFGSTMFPSPMKRPSESSCRLCQCLAYWNASWKVWGPSVVCRSCLSQARCYIR